MRAIVLAVETAQAVVSQAPYRALAPAVVLAVRKAAFLPVHPVRWVVAPVAVLETARAAQSRAQRQARAGVVVRAVRAEAVLGVISAPVGLVAPGVKVARAVRVAATALAVGSEVVETAGCPGLAWFDSELFESPKGATMVPAEQHLRLLPLPRHRVRPQVYARFGADYQVMALLEQQKAPFGLPSEQFEVRGPGWA
jgi:hypothetical protein